MLSGRRSDLEGGLRVAGNEAKLAGQWCTRAAAHCWLLRACGAGAWAVSAEALQSRCTGLLGAASGCCGFSLCSRAGCAPSGSRVAPPSCSSCLIETHRLCSQHNLPSRALQDTGCAGQVAGLAFSWLLSGLQALLSFGLRACSNVAGRAPADPRAERVIGVPTAAPPQESVFADNEF